MSGRACIFVLCLLLTGCASVRPSDTWHAAYIGTATADAVSTEAALRSGGVEINPLLGERPSPAKVAAFKVGGWFAVRGVESYVESQLDRPLHWYEKLALWGIPVAMQSWAAVHNLGVVR
jgi:hypothetical protein